MESIRGMCMTTFVLVILTLGQLISVPLISNSTVRADDDGKPIYNRPQPQLEGVRVDERLGYSVPLEAKFLNEQGQGVAIKEFFKPLRPVLITMNYSNCPMLCSLQLESLVKTLKAMDELAGQDFTLLSVSFDPQETPEQVSLIKKRYLADYGKATDPSAWNFVVGKNDNIREMSDTLGIRYRYNPERKEYSHPATIVVCTPDGVISKYIHGVGFDPATLTQSIDDARRGLVSVPNDSFLPMFCSFYDPNAGTYVVAAMRVMQFAGFCFMCAVLILFWVCHKMVKTRKAQLAREAMKVQESITTPNGLVSQSH
jgi:protein SCO1/2